MNEVLNFLLNPTNTTKKLSTKKDNLKIMIIGLVLTIYSFSSVWSTYFWIFWELYSSSYYMALFIYNILSILVLSLIIWLLGRIMWGKAQYINVLLISSLANIVWIIAHISFIVISFIKPLFLLSLISFISIISLAWFVTILSKWLIKIEKISETKITFIVFFTILILYFVNFFVFWVSWA